MFFSLMLEPPSVSNHSAVIAKVGFEKLIMGLGCQRQRSRIMRGGKLIKKYIPRGRWPREIESRRAFVPL